MKPTRAEILKVIVYGMKYDGTAGGITDMLMKLFDGPPRPTPQEVVDAQWVKDMGTSEAGK